MIRIIHETEVPTGSVFITEDVESQSLSYSGGALQTRIRWTVCIGYEDGRDDDVAGMFDSMHQCYVQVLGFADDIIDSILERG